jgi:hypothetical protein
MKKLFFSAIVGLALASCSTGSNYMSVANSQLNLTRGDVEISKVITAEAKQTLIFGIDFKRLFKADMGSVRGEAGGGATGFSIPIIGGLLGGGGTAKVEGYTYAKLFADNAGYDFVMYPRYSQKSKNIIGIIVKTTGKVECRLGKVK